MEDHHDDCGDDLSSLQEMYVDGKAEPCSYGMDEEFTDLYLSACMLNEYPHLQYSYPIDPSTVARAKPGVPVPGRDPAACNPK